MLTMNVITKFYKLMLVLIVVPLVYAALSSADGSQNVTNQIIV
jgi:hypothetical protein